MVNQEEEVDILLDLLTRTREERLDLLPDAGTFVEVIADAMNALQVAYVMVNMLGASTKQAPQRATFIPVSNPKDAKEL